MSLDVLFSPFLHPGSALGAASPMGGAASVYDKSYMSMRNGSTFSISKLDGLCFHVINVLSRQPTWVLHNCDRECGIMNLVDIA